MNRIRRTALVAGSALATLVLTVTATFGLGRGHAKAQYAQHSSQGQTARSVSDIPASSSGQPASALVADADPSASAGAAATATASASSAAADSADSADTSALPSPEQAGQSPLMHIQGDYDIKSLRRLIELAKDSGFTDDQLQQITVEDEHGHVVNALAFLKAYEQRKKEEAARLAAEKAKVYLTPKDLLKELDEQQSKDLDKLRDKMVFVD